MRPGDRHIVIGQENHLDVQDQHHRQHRQRQPAHHMQEAAHDAGAVGPRDGLHEEEVVQFQPQRVPAPVVRFQQPYGVIEFQRLACQQNQLRDQAQMQKHQNDWRELEELRQLDGHVHHRQLDWRFQKQIAVRDARHRHHEVDHQRKEYEPRTISRLARRVDRLEQAVWIDWRLGLDNAVRHIGHAERLPTSTSAKCARP